MVEINVKEERNRRTCIRARKRLEKREKTQREEAGIASVAVNKRGHEVAGFRNTRKVYGTHGREITSRKHARLRHPNGYETCVCAHILRVSSPIAMFQVLVSRWSSNYVVRISLISSSTVVFDRFTSVQLSTRDDLLWNVQGRAFIACFKRGMYYRVVFPFLRGFRSIRVTDQRSPSGEANYIDKIKLTLASGEF